MKRFLLLPLFLALVAPLHAQELPRIPPTGPATARATFRTLDGFRMDLLAAEPLVTDPVAIDYDENGLAYVVEMNDYPYTDKSTDKPNVERTTDLPLGKVRILEDVDGDGKFDKSTIFADNLSWPTGICFWKNGVYVAATPDIWYLEDTDGDRKADVRRKVFTGFRKFNVQAVMNNLKWGLDHRIYGAGSSNGGQIRKPNEPGAPPIAISRNDYRFDPHRERFEPLSGGARFGLSFDDWGNRFLCNIRNPVQHVVLPSHYLARNPHLPVKIAIHDAAEFGDQLPVYRSSPPEPWRAVRAQRWAAEAGQNYPRSETSAEGFFTSSSGITIYRGNAYPAKYYGNAFIAEVAGNLIHRQTLTPQGVTFVAQRADEKIEFVSSIDNWFRPVNFYNAPDGTLHVLDMYRETIEHPWSIPDDLKALVDLESGRDRGRIYRLSPPGFEVPPPPRLGKASTAELVATLENPNSWWRDTAHRLLYQRQDSAAIEPLRQLLNESKSPLARLHALWSLEGLNQLADADLLRGLSDTSGGVREHAVRLSESRLAKKPALLEQLLALADDLQPRVRFQTAFSLGEVHNVRVTQALAAIARRDAADEWIRMAVLCSAKEVADELLRQLLADREFVKSAAGLVMQRQLAVVVGARANSPEIEQVLHTLVEQTNASRADRADNARALQREVINGLGDGLRRANKNLMTTISYMTSNAPSRRLVLDALAEAQRTATDERQAPADREQAIQLLGNGEFDKVSATLTSRIEPRQPQNVQMAAVRTLASFNHPQVASLLIAGWSGCTPPVRGEVVEALLSRTDRLDAFFDAIESKKIPTAQVPATRQALLLKNPDEKIRNRAARLFATDAPSPRKEVIALYQPALKLAADKERGRKVFEQNCLACHKLADKGHDVGPNLSTIRHRTPEEVLLHVLDPNREVQPNFLEYVLVTDDGRIVTGIIGTETATSITLRRAENVQETILRQNIEQISSTGKSLMPEGFEQKIKLPEMADLLAFLLGLR